MAFHPLFALPEVDKLDTEKGYLLGTTNQLFLNFAKIKADIVVDLDKFTLFTMTEIREASKMKSANSVIAPDAIELQKIMKNHTSYEKKVAFKFVSQIKPKKPA